MLKKFNWFLNFLEVLYFKGIFVVLINDSKVKLQNFEQKSKVQISKKVKDRFLSSIPNILVDNFLYLSKLFQLKSF